MGSRKVSRLVVAGCLLVLSLETVQAAEWRFSPWIAVRETYSDNINLQPSGGEYDFVTDISPGINLRGEGRRFFLSLLYNLQYLNYARESSNDRFNNQLQLIGNAELAEDWFFIDLRSTVRQVNISNRGNTANSTISITDNETTQGTLTVSPYLKHRFGSFAEGEARYTYDKVAFSSDGNDSQIDSVFLDLKSGSQFQTLTWDTYYSWRHEDPEAGQNITFERVQLNGRYNFNRKYALFFGTGYEDNDFFTTKTDSTSAVTWLAGASWRPNQRTLVEGGAENRFFGVAPFLNITYRSRRTALALRYFEDVTTTNQGRTTETFIPLVDAFGDPILDPNTGDFILIPVTTPSISNEVVVNQTLEGTLAVRGRRTNVGATLYAQRRNFQISPDEEVYGLRLFADRQLSRYLSLNLWGNVEQSDFDASNDDRTQWQVGVGLRRQFARSLSGRINYQYIQQDSSNPSLEYDENRVTLSLTKYF